MQNNGLVKVREFLSKTDLLGTDLKLQESIMKTDSRLGATRAEFEKISKNYAEKQAEVAQLASQLEGLCQLVVVVMTETEKEVPVEGFDKKSVLAV